MALKDIIRGLTGRKPAADQSAPAPLASDLFPVIQASGVDMARYRKLPLESIGALGAAFAALPESARTVTSTIVGQTTSPVPLFVQLNPGNVKGFTRTGPTGTNGNIYHINAQGKQVIAGRMTYQQTGSLPVSGVSASVIPFDPMTLAIAAALAGIRMQLDEVQQKAEEILQFLKADKQSRQRGNLNALAEIMADYRREGGSERFCALHFPSVQSVKRDAFQDMDFYHNRVSAVLQKQKGLHGSGHVQMLTEELLPELREYQLACHLYGYATLLETLLGGDFTPDALQTAIGRSHDCADRYNSLYGQCHEQLGSYQRGALQARLLGSLGSMSRSLGEKIAATPVLRNGPVDEALISAGQSLAQRNHDAAAGLLEQFEPLADCPIAPFADALQMLAATQQPAGLLCDGEALYVLSPA